MSAERFGVFLSPCARAPLGEWLRDDMGGPTLFLTRDAAGAKSNEISSRTEVWQARLYDEALTNPTTENRLAVAVERFATAHERLASAVEEIATDMTSGPKRDL